MCISHSFLSHDWSLLRMVYCSLPLWPSIKGIDHPHCRAKPWTRNDKTSEPWLFRAISYAGNHHQEGTISFISSKKLVQDFARAINKHCWSNPKIAWLNHSKLRSDSQTFLYENANFQSSQVLPKVGQLNPGNWWFDAKAQSNYWGLLFHVTGWAHRYRRSRAQH